MGEVMAPPVTLGSGMQLLLISLCADGSMTAWCRGEDLNLHGVTPTGT